MLYTNDTYDLAGVWYSEKEKKLLGVSYEGHKGTTRHFFDREAGELFGRMERHLRGYELGIVGSDKADHEVMGGLGSAVAEVVAKSGKACAFKMMERAPLTG